jgi:hypothetical protein
MGSGLAKSNLPVGDGVIHQVAPQSVASASDRFPSVATLIADGRTPGEHQRVSDLESFSRQQENAGLGLKVGLRDNLRLSFPRVYGLVNRQSVLLDRELFAETDRLPIRVGLAAGETRFSQKFSTDTGGSTRTTSSHRCWHMDGSSQRSPFRISWG